jgi:hypothetical protein
MGDTRVTFDIRQGLITVEGPAADLNALFETVRAAAPSLKEIRVIASNGGSLQESGSVSGEPRSERKPSLRDFARKFSLENTSQRIAVLAYHAVRIDGKGTFTVKEMNDWFGLCGFKKPTQMPVALQDAKRKYGYVETKGRDQWTIATGGENLVLELVESRGAL